MQLVVSPNNELLSKFAAEEIAECIKKKPGSLIALPTGSTPEGLYKELVKKFEKGSMDFSKTCFLNLDEYVGLSQRHARSYSSYLRKNFLNKVNCREKNVFLFNGKANAQQEAKKIAAVIKNGLDMAILGIGENCHIAFNEPGSSFNSKVRVVKLSKSTIKANSRFFKNKVPKKAITLGISDIMKAKKIILLASGRKKARALKETLESKISEKKPSTILRKHKNCIVIAEAEAASLTRKNRGAVQLNNTKIFFPENLPTKKRIVFFSPHPDDSAIAAGALLSELAKKNFVTVLNMTSGHRAVFNNKSKREKQEIRERESIEEGKILGIKTASMGLEYYDDGEKSFVRDKKSVREKILELKPEIVFLPQKKDMHPTHAIARRLIIEALAACNAKPELWAYETPWALFGHKEFNAVFEFGEQEIEKKMLAIKQHESQIKRTRFDTAAKSIARFRAITIAEQILSDFGEKPPKMQKFMELFNISIENEEEV